MLTCALPYRALIVISAARRAFTVTCGQLWVLLRELSAFSVDFSAAFTGQGGSLFRPVGLFCGLLFGLFWAGGSLLRPLGLFCRLLCSFSWAGGSFSEGLFRDFLENPEILETARAAFGLTVISLDGLQDGDHRGSS